MFKIIVFKIKFTTEAAMRNIKERFHEALIGSPGYVESEIAITDGDYNDEFILVVGNSNNNNITFNIFADNTFEKEDAKSSILDIIMQLSID